MAWIQNLSRFRHYADSVVHQAGQAVVGGAKLLRLGTRNDRGYNQTIERLEQLSISCRGEKRTLLLKKWLFKLKEAERILGELDGALETNHVDDDASYGDNESLPKNTVLFRELDTGVDPDMFRDVFLDSEALEGMTLSMISEVPSDEEAQLILEIFDYCLIGGTEVHKAILSSIQDLGKVFSCYQDEVLMKREELLEFARTSISGLKINAQQARIDMEVLHLKTELSEKETKIPPIEAHLTPFAQQRIPRNQALKEAVAQVRIYSKLQELLTQNKALNYGLPPEAHAQKVDKLKILMESLSNSTTNAEKRIEDHRLRKEEALNFRLAKVNQVSQVEKDLEAELDSLQRQKEKLEEELERVNNSILMANRRLQNVVEERQQFDETSTDILEHLQFKEKEVLQSIASYKVEATVASAWISFVESTWRLQCNFTKQKEEHINNELSKYAESFLNLSSNVLSAYENELKVSIDLFRDYVQKLKDGLGDISPFFGDEALKSAKNWKKLEEEYLEMEAKLVPAFKVVENIKQLRAKTEEFCRKDDQNVERLLDELQKMKEDFDSIERPNFESETPTSLHWRSIVKLGFKEIPVKLEPIIEEPEFAKVNGFSPQKDGFELESQFVEPQLTQEE